MRTSTAFRVYVQIVCCKPCYKKTGLQITKEDVHAREGCMTDGEMNDNLIEDNPGKLKPCLYISSLAIKTLV